MRRHGKAAARHRVAAHRAERGRIVFVEYFVARAMAEARKKGRAEESETAAFMRASSGTFTQSEGVPGVLGLSDFKRGEYRP